MLKEALLYNKVDDDKIKCFLCPHGCTFKGEGRGICSVRIAKDGKLYTENYGEITAINLDPIEKKPLYHFKLGKNILSVGSYGCNFKCGFCQNYSISQYKARSNFLEPSDLIKIANEQKKNGNIGIAFTYNEPSLSFEYIMDVAKIKGSLDIVLVTNGYITIEALKELIPYVSAMNIDLKAFNNDFYKKTCGGDIDHVLRTIEFAASKTHVELTTLIIPEYNDDLSELEELSIWVSKIDKGIPIHLSKFFPSYEFDQRETPNEVMFKSAEIMKKHLDHVYIGNVVGVKNDIICKECKATLIKRTGFSTEVYMEDNKCIKCGKEINIML